MKAKFRHYGVAEFIYFLLWNVNRFINRTVNILIARTIYCLIFSILHVTFKDIKQLKDRALKLIVHSFRINLRIRHTVCVDYNNKYTGSVYEIFSEILEKFRRRTRGVGVGGSSPLPFFGKTGKKCPNFWEKMPWLRSSKG